MTILGPTLSFPPLELLPFTQARVTEDLARDAWVVSLAYKTRTRPSVYTTVLVAREHLVRADVPWETLWRDYYLPHATHELRKFLAAHPREADLRAPRDGRWLWDVLTQDVAEGLLSNRCFDRVHQTFVDLSLAQREVFLTFCLDPLPEHDQVGWRRYQSAFDLARRLA